MYVNTVRGPNTQFEKRIGPIERVRFLAIGHVEHEHASYRRLAIVGRDRSGKHNRRVRVVQMRAVRIVVIEPRLQLSCMIHAMNAEQHSRCSPQTKNCLAVSIRRQIETWYLTARSHGRRLTHGQRRQPCMTTIRALNHSLAHIA